MTWWEGCAMKSDESSLADLLNGAVDTHVHAGPAYIRRRDDALTMARRAEAAGMRGLVLKDHHTPTSTLAAQVDQEIAELSVIGSVVMNASIGGINPSAAETSIAVGARVVWLPTVSARAHKEAIASQGVRFPAAGREPTRSVEDVVPVTDEAGHLLPEVWELLDVLAANRDVVLATGHVAADEVTAIVAAARHRGVERIVVTHPDYIVGASLDQMSMWAQAGAMCEVAGSTSWTRSSLACIPTERTVEVIRRIGANALILASDFGQRDNPPHLEALQHWIEELVGCGVTGDEVRTMLVDNPSQLLSIERRP